MLGLRLFSRLALPVRPTPLAVRTRPALPPLARLVISRYSSDSPEDLQGSTSKEPIPAHATVSRLDNHERYVTSRLDEQDHQIEGLGKEMKDLGKEMKDLRMEIKDGFRGLDRSVHEIESKLHRSIHEVESKFHATLSQWIFRAAMLTVGVALVSASAFLFPGLKQLLDAWVMQSRAGIVEREARAEREQIELKKVKSEVV